MQPPGPLPLLRLGGCRLQPPGGARAPPGQRARRHAARRRCAALGCGDGDRGVAGQALQRRVRGPAAAAVVAGPPRARPPTCPAGGRAAGKLRRRFLPVFWLLRMADGSRGPTSTRLPARYPTASPGRWSWARPSRRLRLDGALRALRRAAGGRARPQAGHARYAAHAGAATTKSPVLWGALRGSRAASGRRSSLGAGRGSWATRRRLSSGAAGGARPPAGDALVAILAGQLAAAAAAMRGPTGPLELSAPPRRARSRGPPLEENAADAGAAGRALRARRRRDGPRRLQDPDRRRDAGALEGAMYIFAPAAAGPRQGRGGSSARPPRRSARSSVLQVCCLLGSTTPGAGPRARRASAGTRAFSPPPRPAPWTRRRGRDGVLRGLLRLRSALVSSTSHAGPSTCPRPARIIMNLRDTPPLVVGCFLSISSSARGHCRGGRLALAAAAAADLARTTRGARPSGAIGGGWGPWCQGVLLFGRARDARPPVASAALGGVFVKSSTRRCRTDSAPGERGCAGPCR